MVGPVGKSGLCIAATTMVLAPVPADAAMACWGDEQVAAARVRDLQSRLMVATLRCNAMGIDIREAYDAFVRANRETIQAANAVIMGQFERGYGAGAQDHYDRFATALANAYGDDRTDGAVCADTAAVAAEAVAAGGDVRRLVELEAETGPAPALPGGVCVRGFAYAESIK